MNLTEKWLEKLNTPGTEAHLTKLYGAANLQAQKERYAALGLKPYGGFINPDIVPVEKGGRIVDYKLVYNDDYLEQMLAYGRKYRTLD